MGDLNEQVFRFVNGWPDGWSPFWRFFSEAANQLWFKLTMAALVLLMLALGKPTRRTVLQALIAWPIANELTNILKAAFPEPRPFQVHPGDVALRAGWAASHGTASAHAANMAAIAFAFTYGLRWWGLPWIAVAVLTGISRVYVGVHYPYQVVLGWTCGIVSGAAVAAVWNRVARTRASDEGSVSPPAPHVDQAPS